MGHACLSTNVFMVVRMVLIWNSLTLVREDVRIVTMPITRRTFLTAGMMLAAAAPLCEFESQADPVNRSLVDLVNPLQGTNSSRPFSRGNTLPIVTRPFGMTHWIPQSNLDDRWFFDPKSRDFVGVRATHEPCPWAGDYANFTVMAETAEERYSAGNPFPTFAPGDLEVHPHYFSVVLKSSKIKIETTATERCAVIRIVFPKGHSGRITFTSLTQIATRLQDNSITGASNFGTRPAQPRDASGYLAAHFSQRIRSATPTVMGLPQPHRHMAQGASVGVILEFDPDGPLEIKIGTSFISSEQAGTNLTREVGDRSFDQICQESKAAWNASLACALVSGGTPDEERTFYSCLYRTKLWPRVLHEYTADGKQIHYSSADDRVHPGPSYGDVGFWDTYRTQFPLLSILEPEKMGEMVQGFVNGYREGGWLPQWPSPGWGFSMPGTHGDSVVAEAFVKNLPGFDRIAAAAAVQKDADVPGTVGGRGSLTDYIIKGYIPYEHSGPAAASTLDYAYDDFCASQVAAAIGKTEDQERYRDRSLNYRNLYDAEVGFINGKSADGVWNRPFDPITWGGPFIEAAAWQSTWSVPHDTGGLMHLMGGRHKFVRKLDAMLLQAPRFNVGTYGQVIHEMAEMAAFEFGQYDQGNQPVHIALYLFAAAGCPWKTQYYTRRVLREMYSPDSYPGDDDNGEMSAWYVLSALGIYPLCPSHPSYILGSPLFPNVRLKVGNGKLLQITAPGNSPDAVYVNGVHLNGVEHKHLWISHSDIVSGGELRFTMASRPLARELQTEDMPFSLTTIEGPIQTEAFETSVRISCGSDSDSGSFVGDAFFKGGKEVQTSGLDSIGSIDPGVVAIYQSARVGAFSYSIPLPTPPAPQTYTLRLHFVETSYAPKGSRLQNITVNGQTMLTGFDIASEAQSGTAVIREFFHVLPNREGRIVVGVRPATNSQDKMASMCGIEIFSS